MNRIKNSSLKRIRYRDVLRMKQNQVVVVSRASLNSTLVDVTLKSPSDYEERSKLIRDAIISISKQETLKKHTLIGAKMKVSDVIRVFNGLISLDDSTTDFYISYKKGYRRL